MCSTPPGVKSFGIGPSSMEGDLHISPGDCISGGYNFKFVDRSHAATAYTVVATVTVPVSCPNGTTQNIVIPLGQPGVLDGGGATSFTYSIPAGDTQNHATNNQNSILVWEGAVRAPATLCGGQTGRNQVGAVFNATVLQEPMSDSWIGNSTTAIPQQKAKATSTVRMRATRSEAMPMCAVHPGVKHSGTHKTGPSSPIRR
jgi:hypothetical protein